MHDLSLMMVPPVQGNLEVEPNLTVIRHPVQILDRDEKRL